MNKSTKGLIAAAAGLTLLTGVGGTFANWSESDTQAPGAVTAGNLDMTLAETGTWADTTPVVDVPLDATALAAFRMVPGDTLTYTTTVDVAHEGDNLDATLTAAVSTSTGGLADFVDVTADINNAGAATISVTEDMTAVPVTVTITMDDVETTASEGETLSVDLTSLALALNQV